MAGDAALFVDEFAFRRVAGEGEGGHVLLDDVIPAAGWGDENFAGELAEIGVFVAAEEALLGGGDVSGVDLVMADAFEQGGDAIRSLEQDRERLAAELR